MSVRVRGALLAASLLFTCAAGASPPESSAAPVQVREALSAAWEAHPASRAARATVAAARARLAAARRPAYNPELGLDADDEGSDGDRTATVGLSQSFETGGKRQRRIAVAEAELVAARREVEQKRAEFSRDWLRAWANWDAAQRQVRVGEERVGLSQRFATLAERQLGVGDISALERDLAVLSRDEALAEQAGLIVDESEAREAFRTLGGGDAAIATLPILSELPLPPAATDVAIESLAALPEWRAADARADAAEARIASAQAARRPDPTFGVRAGRIDFGPSTGNVVGLSFSMPIYIRNDYAAEVAAARAESDVAASEAARVRLELEARLERASRVHAAVLSAAAQWRASRGGDATARADLLERLWRAGELSTADFLVQLRQALDTAVAGAALDGRVWQGWIDWLYASGRLDEWMGFETSEEAR
mgnify:CR=1 FL=1